MRYTKSALGLLNAQYRSVLKKCLLINLGLFALAAISATPAHAASEAEIVVKINGSSDITYGTVKEGTTNGTINIKADAIGVDADIPVHGLGSAAYKNDTDFDAFGAAAAVQGTTTETVKSVDDKVTALDTRVTTAEGKISTLETTVGDSTSGLVKDTADLKTTVGDASSGLVKDVADLNTWKTNLATANGVADAVDGSNIKAGSVAKTALASDVQTTLGNADTLYTNLGGVTATATELNYMSGVTSGVQAQLNGKQATIDSGNKLDADLVDDSTSTNKFVTATDKTTWNAKQEQVIAGTGISLASDNKTISVSGLTTSEFAAGTVVSTAIDAGAGASDKLASTAALGATRTAINSDIATALATANTNIDNAITYDSTSGLITFKNSDGTTVDSTAYSKDKADLTFAGLAASNTFSNSNTFNGGVTMTQGLSITGGTLSTTGNATVGGTLGVTGALTGSTATFSGKVTSVGLDAGAGAIQTTGALKGATLETTDNATVGGDLDVAGDATVDGDLDVTGDISADNGIFNGDVDITGDLAVTGDLSADNATVTTLKIGSSAAVDSVDDGSAALTSGNATTLASTATVLKSAENATYTGATVKGASPVPATLKDAISTTTASLNNILTTAGDEVDSAKVDVQWGGVDSTLKTALGAGFAADGNEIDAGDSVTTALSSLDTAIGDRTITSANSAINTALATDISTAVAKIGDEIGTQAYSNTASVNYNAIAANTDLTTAVSQVSSNIGAPIASIQDRTKGKIATTNTVNANIAALDAAIGADVTKTYNNVATANSINENLDAINATIGDITDLHAGTGSTGDAITNGTGVPATTVVEALNNIDSTLGNIHGLKDVSDLGANSNLAPGTTVENHLVSLDNSIGNRNITSANAAINNQTAISTAAGLQAAGNAIGDMNFSSTRYASGSQDLSSAIRSLDSNIYRIDREVSDLKHDFKSGMASMAAMTALVPNARSCGDTSLSLGTGAYDGHTAMAIGGFHYLNDNLLLNAGVAWGNTDDLAYRMGVTFSW